MLKRGYWISPHGNIIDLKGQRHIEVVCDNPEGFGLTPGYIRETYLGYGEPLRSELRARNEIMYRLIRNGFIRIREQRNRWKIQLWALDPVSRGHLDNWKSSLGDGIDRYADLLIEPLGMEFEGAGKRI